MLRVVVVFGGVFVFGVIAATRLSAGLAGPQMYPSVAGLDAFDTSRVLFQANLL